MIKNKKGAEHVDWAISIGIFLIFLLSILVYIKPVYKPTYEAETLGEMVKNSFLAENNATIYRTLVIVKYKEQTPPCDSIKVDFNSLGDNIYVTMDFINQAEKYKKDDNSILFQNLDLKYWVYYNLNEGKGSNTGINSGWTPSNNCLNSEKGEITEYTGLKSTSVTKVDTPVGFPDSKQFILKIRNANTGEVLGGFPSKEVEPPEDVSVYVYEFVYPTLEFINIPGQGKDYIKKTNYIVSIQIW